MLFIIVRAVITALVSVCRACFCYDALRCVRRHAETLMRACLLADEIGTPVPN